MTDDGRMNNEKRQINRPEMLACNSLADESKRERRLEEDVKVKWISSSSRKREVGFVKRVTNTICMEKISGAIHQEFQA